MRVLLHGAGIMGLVTMLGLAAPASADPSAPIANNATMKALISTPAMQQAIAAAHKGDARSAAAYLHEAAQQGNPLAQATLGRMYFEGKGVPRNYAESLKWLKLAVARNQEPALSFAVATLRAMSLALRNSPDARDRAAGIAADLAPLLENPHVKEWLRNAARNPAPPQQDTFVCIGSMIATCF